MIQKLIAGCGLCVMFQYPEKVINTIRYNSTHTLKLGRGYLILIAGGALVVSGIVVSALGTGSLIGSFLKDSTVIAQTLIKPSESVNATLRVSDIGRTISLAIHTNSKAPNATVNELVRDSYGSVVSNRNFQREILSAFKPTTSGEYVLTISNYGPSSVNVDGMFVIYQL